MLITFRSWDSFGQCEGRETFIDPESISAIEDQESRGWAWAKVHLKNGTVLPICDTASNIKIRCRI